MSSPASRQRQRHRRRTREKTWAAQKDLANRQVDLVSYERVIIDMTTRRELTPFGEAIGLVTLCRDATRSDCEKLLEVVAALKRKAAALEPSDPDQKETLRP